MIRPCACTARAPSRRRSKCAAERIALVRAQSVTRLRSPFFVRLELERSCASALARLFVRFATKLWKAFIGVDVEVGRRVVRGKHGMNAIVFGELARSSPPSAHVHAPTPKATRDVVVYDAPMLEDSLRGDSEATRALVDDLTPVIQSRAARAVLRRRERGVYRRDIAQEVEELTQEVFLVLFADDGRVLRAWNPARGLSLRNYVGMVAEREISDILQSGRRRPWNERRTPEEPTEAELGTCPGPEDRIAAKELYTRVIARLREELSPKGFELFEMLLVDGCAVDDACAATGMTREAIYAWRSRLPKIVRRIAESVLGD